MTAAPELRAVEVSVVIPCYRSRHTIGDTLGSVLQQDFAGAIEVLVVDSSDDGTAEWIRQHFPQVQVHHSSSRLTPGPARNLGAQLSRGTLLAFIDADVRAAPDWLSTLHRRMAEQAVVVVGAAIANANPETRASRTLYWLEFSEFLPDQPAGFRDCLSSSNLLIRRSDFLAAGGFSSEFGMSEDSIFSRAVGRGLFLETATRIFHRHRTDWAVVREHLYRLGYWSGRFRAAFVTRGSWLRRVPLVSFGLIPWRLFHVIRRIRGQHGALAPLVREMPALIAGLWSWNKGFYRGIRQRPHAVPPGQVHSTP